MSRTIPSKQADAFTRTELLVIVAVLLFLGIGFVMWRQSGHLKTRQTRCVNNLKQIGLAFRIWPKGSDDRYPMNVSTNSQGSMEYILTGETFQHFQAMAPELGSAAILICPEDNRQAARSFVLGLANTNLSYFVGVDGDETRPQMLLSGDRDITNSASTFSRLLTVTTNDPAGWSRRLHRGVGNVCLSDGSVQSELDATRLRWTIAEGEAQLHSPMRLAMPVP